jgi:acyl phosphate:glycerol-3-phosphate acyltransferase
MTRLAAALVLGYAAGCFNTGYYLVRTRTGRDLRAEGSGTAGATNTGRLLGRWGFAVALAGDLVKGALVVALARWLGGDGPASAAVVGVVLGHVYPAQLAFRGGKGLATAFGAGLVLVPIPALIAGGIAAALLALTRRRVLSALTGVASAPVSALVLHGAGPVPAGLAVAATIILIRHAAARGPTPAPRADPASPGAG